MDVLSTATEMATGNMKAMGALLLSVTLVTALAPSAAAGQFKKPVYYKVGPTGALPWSVVSADFNGDGNLDLAVSDLGVSQVTLLLGDGKGAFHSGGHFSVPAASAMAVGDFNGDHIPDLAIIEWGGTGYSSLTIFLGKGDGTFQNSFTYQVGVQATSVAVADFNGDGRPDIAVANYGSGSGNDGSVMVFFGKGDGTFNKPAIYKLPAPNGIAAGDLNGDHHPDLVATGWNDSTVAILMNTGRGKFKHTATYSLGNTLEPNSVVIGNLVQGGHADLVVSDGSQGISVLLGNGDGTFGNPTFYSTRGEGNGPQASVIADFNHDGKPDVATALYQKNSALFYGNGDGTFQAAVPINLIDGGHSLVTGDFNKDGNPDLAIIVQPADKIAILLNAE